MGDSGYAPYADQTLPNELGDHAHRKNHGDVLIESFTVDVNIEDARELKYDTPVFPGDTTQVTIPMAGYTLKRNGTFIWLSFSSDTPHMASSSFSYSVWIAPEEY